MKSITEICGLGTFLGIVNRLFKNWRKNKSD
jgi:hypothetical protein